MPSSWRTVRVFLSSTFRDMHAERDHLARTVFPALREKCRPLRIHLIDVPDEVSVHSSSSRGLPASAITLSTRFGGSVSYCRKRIVKLPRPPVMLLRSLA